jgi:hypothetical protein
MYFRAIQSRYDEDASGPTFEHEDMIDAGMTGFREFLRDAVAKYRRTKRDR